MAVTRILALLLGLAASLWLAACGNDGDLPVGKELTVQSESFSFSDDKFDFFTEYRIVPGDQLDVLFSIQTWEKEASFQIQLGDTVSIKFMNAPQYNETQTVRPDGRISLPFLGPYEVSGRSVEELTAELNRRYASLFRNPDVLVTVPEFLSQIRELKRDLHTSSRGLSRLVTVRPDGFTTFPMVGEVEVGDRTIKEVAATLNSQYERISPSLKVDLFLEQHSGAMVYVLGEVQKPGAYTIRRPLTVVEALAMASGTTSDARLDHVLVVRKQGKDMVATRIDVQKTLATEKGAKFFYVSKDDIIFVPEQPMSEAARVAQRLMNIMMFRGWGISLGGSVNLTNNPLFQ